MTALAGLAEYEGHHPDGDEDSHHVLVELVLLVADHLAHGHDGDDLAGL